jgi:hypothetical protein
VSTEVKPHEGELNPGIPKNACTEVSVAFATDPVKLRLDKLSAVYDEDRESAALAVQL